MAADVSSLRGFLSRYDKEDSGESGGGEGNLRGDLVTRDLLGGSFAGGGRGVAAVAGAKKELDVLPEKAYFHQRGSGGRPLQDLNMPPICYPGLPPPPQPEALSAPAFDLKLLLPSRTPSGYSQNVCTLEKVKSALERAHRDDSLRKQPEERRLAAGSGSPASSSSTTTPSAKRRREVGLEDEWEGESRSTTSSSSSVVVQEEAGATAADAMAAAGCPNCLLYVLISRVDPRCPRCNAQLPLPPPPGKKRPRIGEAAAAAATAVDPLKTVIFF